MLRGRCRVLLEIMIVIVIDGSRRVGLELDFVVNSRTWFLESSLVGR